jgi:hypothetical protein
VNGAETLKFLRAVRKKLGVLSTNDSGSLGLHPLVYCYSSSGNFQPNAFLATLEFAAKLDQNNKKKAFIDVRKRFETYLLLNRTYVSLTMSRLGAGARSLSRLVDLYWLIFERMSAGDDDPAILQSLVARPDFVHLKQLEIPSPRADAEPSKRGASAASKSAAFIQQAMNTPLRCKICGASVHANSVTFDHITRRDDGGNNTSTNLQPTHPFCNSGVKA